MRNPRARTGEPKPVAMTADAPGASLRCRLCGGAAHPSCGAQYGARWLVCWRCELEFWAWAREHTNKRGSRRSRRFSHRPACCFYSAAGKWSELLAAREAEAARDKLIEQSEPELEPDPYPYDDWESLRDPELDDLSEQSQPYVSVASDDKSCDNGGNHD